MWERATSGFILHTCILFVLQVVHLYVCEIRIPGHLPIHACIWKPLISGYWMYPHLWAINNFLVPQLALDSFDILNPIASHSTVSAQLSIKLYCSSSCTKPYDYVYGNRKGVAYCLCISGLMQIYMCIRTHWNSSKTDLEIINSTHGRLIMMIISNARLKSFKANFCIFSVTYALWF